MGLGELECKILTNALRTYLEDYESGESITVMGQDISDKVVHEFIMALLKQFEWNEEEDY